MIGLASPRIIPSEFITSELGWGWRVYQYSLSTENKPCQRGLGWIFRNKILKGIRKIKVLIRLSKWLVSFLGFPQTKEKDQKLPQRVKMKPRYNLLRSMKSFLQSSGLTTSLLRFLPSYSLASSYLSVFSFPQGLNGWDPTEFPKSHWRNHRPLCSSFIISLSA